LVSDQAADLLAAYSASGDDDFHDAMDNTLTSAPPPLRSMIGANDRATLRIPKTLVSNIERPLVSVLALSADTGYSMPALFTTMVTSVHISAAAAISSSFVTSIPTGTTSASVIVAGSRAAPYTLAAPASRKARAYAAPIPRLAPVISTVVPDTFMAVPFEDSWVGRCRRDRLRHAGQRSHPVAHEPCRLLCLPAAGSSEVQRNILDEMVLGRPRYRDRPDRKRRPGCSALPLRRRRVAGRTA
jgi:hypothetical protein